MRNVLYPARHAAYGADLSILYLRCVREAREPAHRSRRPFNSLFEMPTYRCCSPRHLQQTFNSLFEMLPLREGVLQVAVLPFNSLFEMQHEYFERVYRQLQQFFQFSI